MTVQKSAYEEMLSKRGLLGLWTERMEFVKVKFLWSFN